MSPTLQLRIISVGSFWYCWELNPLVCWQKIKGWDTLLYDDFVKKYVVNTNEGYQQFTYSLLSFCLIMHILWVGLFHRTGQRWADVRVVLWNFGAEGSDRSSPFLRWIQGKQSFWWRGSPLVADVLAIFVAVALLGWAFWWAQRVAPCLLEHNCYGSRLVIKLQLLAVGIREK